MACIGCVSFCPERTEGFSNYVCPPSVSQLWIFIKYSHTGSLTSQSVYLELDECWRQMRTAQYISDIKTELYY